MWKKTKKWLIKKLGGYESPVYFDYNIEHITYPTVPIAVERIVDRALCNDEDIEYIIQHELAPLLAETMIEDKLVNITIDHIGSFNGWQAVVRASCKVVDSRGEKE